MVAGQPSDSTPSRREDDAYQDASLVILMCAAATLPILSSSRGRSGVGRGIWIPERPLGLRSLHAIGRFGTTERAELSAFHGQQLAPDSFEHLTRG
jgi:hypothetical protein